MTKGTSSLERACDTIFRICALRPQPQHDVVEFSARNIGGGPNSDGPTQVTSVLSALVVLGYIENIGRGGNGVIFYRTTRQSLRRLKARVKRVDRL